MGPGRVELLISRVPGDSKSGTRLHDLVVQALRRYVVFAMTDLVMVVRPDCYRVRGPGRAFQRRIGGCEDSPWIVLP